jgi:hypothetical protein
MRDPRNGDVEQLRLLGIFHFVAAGLSFVGVGFLFLHYVMMHAILASPAAWKNPNGGGPSPQQFFDIFKWFYLIFGMLAIAGGLGNLLSGLFIVKRKFRLFSMIMAAVNCIMVPFGTILGVFTLVVLLRDSVRKAYEPPSAA